MKQERGALQTDKDTRNAVIVGRRIGVIQLVEVLKAGDIYSQKLCYYPLLEAGHEAGHLIVFPR
jgi:hypothetical protein